MLDPLVKQERKLGVRDVVGRRRWRLMERMDPVSLWTTSGRKAQQHGTPWTGASGIMLDSGEGLVDAKTRDSNQQHQEVNSTQDRGTGSTSEESSTNDGY